jgi:hypothetical protein
MAIYIMAFLILVVHLDAEAVRKKEERGISAVVRSCAYVMDENRDRPPACGEGSMADWTF